MRPDPQKSQGSGGNALPFTTTKVKDNVLYLGSNHATPRLMRGITGYISAQNA
jgi:hypothetical protein